MPKQAPLLFRWREMLVRDERVTATDRHVALTLAMHMDLNGGSCRPGIRRLASETARKPHTVIAAIRRLQDLKYLQVSRAPKLNAKGWSLDTNQYQARLPLGAAAPVVPSGTRQMPLGATKLFKSYSGAAPKGTAAEPCGECGVVAEINGHAAWCPLLEAAV
jgi:hypothetical protein